MPTRRYLSSTTIPALLLCLIMSISATAAESLEELTKAVQAACGMHDGEALWTLWQVKGQPEELTTALKPFITGILKNKELLVNEIKAVPFDQYKPDREGPGKFKERELEYLVKPTHWVLIRMATPEGANPSGKLKLDMPAAKVDGEWRLIGIRFKK